MHASGLPRGLRHLIGGATGDCGPLGGQDVISRSTVSLETWKAARPSEYRKKVDPIRSGARFAERRHSRPISTQEQPEFRPSSEVVRDMTAEGGQKCTRPARSGPPHAGSGT